MGPSGFQVRCSKPLEQSQHILRGDVATGSWLDRVEVFRVLGFRGLRFKGLGFKGLGV